MAILKVRNPKNEWEAVTDIEFNSIRLSNENTTIKLKSNVLTHKQTTIDNTKTPPEIEEKTVTDYRLSINDYNTEDKFNDLAYLFDLDSLEVKLTKKINEDTENIENILKAYHPEIIKSINNNTIIPEKEYNEYSLTDIADLTINVSNSKRAHGFITFNKENPTITYSGNYKVSGGNFEDGGKIWEFDIYPHNGTNYIIWKNWDLVE